LCDPTAIAIGSLVLGTGGAVASHSAQAKASRENKRNAIAAMREASKDISLLQSQQTQQSARTIFETDRQARSSQALAVVSAGEAGVTGVSVEALLGDIDRKLGESKVVEQRNLEMALKQLQREKISGRTVAQGRIAAVPPPSPFATALSIGAQGLQFWSGQLARKPASDNAAS
jgi:hypothetical protein